MALDFLAAEARREAAEIVGESIGELAGAVRAAATDAERYGSPWLTYREAAAYARTSPQYIRQAVACGNLRAHPSLAQRDGRGDNVHVKKLVNKRDLDALIEAEVVEVPLARAMGID